MSYEYTLSKIRKNINAYNKKCGDPAGYNESITIIFLRKIYSELKMNKNCHFIYEEVDRLSNIYTIDWLYNYFSRDLICSEKAKSQWISPNITQLNF